ncbi:hypothetical protein niasHT_005733 [Heterodera trifolii]|uniref:Uncharacterized protein n=1 Tax=Heterodera trifolii TaxID=157864 RepID=A0ABD2LYS2_9BILA
MSDRRKEAEEKMAKAIFISADCWLCVFDLLEPSQLGLSIALISHRFDFYVDEHFKTRRWALKSMQIFANFKATGTVGVQSANYHWKPMPIPQNQLPKKVVGFEAILIRYINQNVLTFLHRFAQLFATNCPINLAINTDSDRILDCILHNIWPMVGQNIYVLELSPRSFRRLRKFVPSLLNECPSLRFVSFYYGGIFAEFPCNDSANASSGQSVAKWLFTALPNNVPKMYKCSLYIDYDENWTSKIASFKAAFANASSSANFIVVIWFLWSSAFSVAPFDQTNGFTHEQLSLKRINSDCFLLIRCPIARDESKWTKWEKEAIGWHFYDQWNQIDIRIYIENHIGDGFSTQLPAQMISSRSE